MRKSFVMLHSTNYKEVTRDCLCNNYHLGNYQIKSLNDSTILTAFISIPRMYVQRVEKRSQYVK